MAADIEIKKLTTIEELHDMRLVENAVWDMPSIPVHQTYTALNNGGIILGAYRKEELVGFLYSFPGFNGKETYVCSHMLGIKPAYRQNGIGIKLKQKQAELAKEAGYSYITWTFDPLESKNAYVNLHRLRAVGAFYLEDHYGDLGDELNSGLPTDRIQMMWDLKMPSDDRIIMNDAPMLLKIDKERKPQRIAREIEEEDKWVVVIPGDFQAMKSTNFALAKAWRLASREVFQALFAANFQAIDYRYEAEQQQGYYLFEKR